MTKTLPATSRRPRQTALARIRIERIQGNVVSFASPGVADQVWREQLKAALGTVSDAFVEMTLQHLQRAARIPGDGESEMAINGALAMISAAAPRDEVEAALAVQMAVTHMVGMVIMARIGGGHGGDRRLPTLASAAAKLMRAHCLQVETYRRLRAAVIRTSASSTSTSMRAARRSSALSVRAPERLSDKMSRSAARFTQADLARSIRAAKQAGAGTVELLPDGTIRICLAGLEKPVQPVELDREVVL